MRTRDELIRDTEPFPAGVIKTLPPRGDRYVPWYQYAQRLLAHHGGYSWRITDTTFADGVWAVTGELLLGAEIYGSVGEDNTPTSAESNAFKRACAHAGIGLHLYDDAYWLHGKLQRESK